jgi:hypothetical protein
VAFLLAARLKKVMPFRILFDAFVMPFWGRKGAGKREKEAAKDAKSAKEDHEATGSFDPRIVWYMLG